MDRDRFLDEAFTYILSFFENSLQDVGERNPAIEGRIRRISEVGFAATIYRNGSKLGGCYIRISSGMGSRTRSIGYSGNDSGEDNSYNEILTVEADSHNLHLKASLSNWSGQSSNLTFEGAAEKLWQLFVERLT